MKILYSFPAFIICLLYLFLAILLGGIGNFGPLVLIIIALPIVAAVLLSKGKWWGALPGMCLGALLVYSNLSESSGTINLMPVGTAIIVYYAAMGYACYRLHKG